MWSGRLAMVIVFGVAIGVGTPLAAQPVSDEYRLKAAFVYRFPQFVEWPETSVSDTPALDICVLAPNPFGLELERLVKDESVGGRALRVRVVPVDGLHGCHVLYSAAPGDAARGGLKSVVGRPVLTIGEGDGFLDAGGIIALKVVDRRVRFDVDVAHARAAGLRISAQLLRLAATVRGGQP